MTNEQYIINCVNKYKKELGNVSKKIQKKWLFLIGGIITSGFLFYKKIKKIENDVSNIELMMRLKNNSK